MWISFQYTCSHVCTQSPNTLGSFPLGNLETPKNGVTFIYLSCEIFLLLIHARGDRTSSDYHMTVRPLAFLSQLSALKLLLRWSFYLSFCAYLQASIDQLLNLIFVHMSLSYPPLASFPGSSAPERNIEVLHAERAWYLFSREHHQR